jgi:hypothetical protein
MSPTKEKVPNQLYNLTDRLQTAKKPIGKYMAIKHNSATELN